MTDVFLTKEQFNTLYQADNNFVFFMEYVDDDFRYVYINKAAESLYSSNPEGKFMFQVLKSSRQSNIKEYYEKAISTKQSTIFRDFYLFSDDRRTNETVCTPIFQGVHTYVLAVTRNISEQKKLEEKVVFLQSLFEDKIDPTIILLEDLSIFDVNSAFNKFFKCKFAKKQAILESDFIKDKDIKRYFQYIKSTFKGEGSSSVIFSHQKESGEFGNFVVSFSPVYMESKIVAISIQWQELESKVQLKKDLIQTTLLLDSYKDALNVAASICITDEKGYIEFVNKGFERQSQFSVEELVGKTNALLKTREHSQEFYQNLWGTISSGNIWRGEICNQTKYGKIYWVDTTIVPIKDVNGKVIHFLSISFDISDKKAIVTNLRNVEKLFRMITEHTNDFIAITDEDGIIQYVSPVYEARLGYDKEELLGKIYIDLLTEESRNAFLNELKYLKSTKNFKMELEILTKDGQSIWLDSQLSAVKDSGREGVCQFVSVSREITERREMEEQLRFLAYHDSLTMLPNRRYMLEKFEELALDACSSGTSIAILFIDGDNFKKINDIYGHDIGDEFIKHFGRALSSSLRDTDIIARIGGDEFIVFLTNMSNDVSKRNSQIERSIKRIQEVLRNGWVINGNYFSPTSSIGIACYPEDGRDISLLLDKADAALYYAKIVSGKDSYHYADK